MRLRGIFPRRRFLFAQLWDKLELLTKWPLKISNGNLSRKKDAHWRHFVFHINRFRFKAVAERRQ